MNNVNEWENLKSNLLKRRWVAVFMFIFILFTGGAKIIESISSFKKINKDINTSASENDTIYYNNQETNTNLNITEEVSTTIELSEQDKEIRKGVGANKYGNIINMYDSSKVENIIFGNQNVTINNYE